MKILSYFYSVLVACLLAMIGQAAQAEDHLYDWTKAFGGTGWDEASSVATDSNGNMYVVGDFPNTVDFDPGAGVDNRTSAGSYDVFVSKYDASGNYQWTKAFGGTSNEYAHSVAVDTSGNVYLGGYFGNTVDFDAGAGVDNRTSAGSHDAFLSKYDASGNYQWTKAFGGTGGDGVIPVAIDSSGNVYIGGSFENTVDFDPGAGVDNRTSAGSYDAFLSKYDASGNYQWTKAFGGTGEDEVTSVAINSSGNVYLGGYFANTVDFDPGAGVDNRTSAGIYDAFLSKYDASGNYQWTKAFGGTGVDLAWPLATDSSGNVYLGARFENTVDFDPGAGVDNRTSAGSSDAFISKYDASGNYQWTKAFGGTGDDGATSVAIDSSGNVYLGGFFENTVDFDPGAGVDNWASAGIDDVFISKYDGSGNYQWTKAFGGTGSDVAIPVATDSSGNVYIGGYFANTVDFDPGAGVDNRASAGSYDAFVSKYTYDATPPLAPVVALPTSGTSTNNAGTSISGTAEANSTVAIYLNGVLSGTATADSGGTWSYPTTLTDGNYSITATATDSAINTSPASSAVILTIDTQAPAVPVSSTPIWGNRTDDLTPTFSGTGEASATLKVWLDGILLNTIPIDVSGAWSWTPGANLGLGMHILELSVIDSAQNESAKSTAYSFQLVDDYDNDGLTTDQEASAGTDPHNADSDSDGLSDGEEVSRGTNPLSTDSDSDGLLDNQEITYATDPTNPDSDGDGVIDGEEIQDGTNPNNTDTDSDGLSDSQERTRATNPLDDDSDDDGVIDGEEVAEGTNPLDRGSVLARRDKALCTEWNGFLGMWNVLEHVNTGTRKLSMESTLHDISGVAQAPVTFGLKSGYQYDLLVHDLVGFEADTYGLICSTGTNGQAGDLDGRMVFYKPDAVSGGYQFAFALPLGNGLKGTQYVPYNTYQPSLELSDAGNLAANWIQLTNLGATKQTGDLVFYDQAGAEISRQAVTLKAGARFDYSAHDIAGLKSVGLIEWIPQVNTVPFQLRNVRYYYRADGISVPLGDDFDSAFQLEGLVGSGQVLTVPLDTENSSAVLELANTLNEEANAEVTIYAATGGEALHHQTYKLKPHATYHLITDSILKGRQGIATVKGNKPASVVATAMQYGRTATLGLQTSYGIQASEALGTAMRGSYNTFLKQGCRLLLVNPTATEARATISMKRYDGTNVELGRLLAVPAHGLTDYDLCGQDEEDVYGVVTVQPEIRNTIFATVLRIGESEQYRFPTPVRE